MPCHGPTVLYEDNQGCIKLACNEKLSARIKHIDIRHHYFRDFLARGRPIIDLKYCASDIMLADIMTKPLGRDKLNYINSQLGFCTKLKRHTIEWGVEVATFKHNIVCCSVFI